MQNQEIFAIDYAGNKTMTGVMADEVLVIFVEILTGDEILRIVKKNGTAIFVESCSYRYSSYEDGNYVVMPKDLEKWLQRTDPYNPFGDEDEGGESK